MDKNILAAIIGLDETEALVIIEPFHNPGNRNRRGRIRGAALRARRIAKSARRRCAFRRAGGVNLEDPRDLGAFYAIADIDLQFRAGGHRLISRRLKCADMQECVAGSVAQLDEAETFIALEPFDDRVNARSAWRRDFRAPASSPRSSIAGSGSAANHRAMAHHRRNRASWVPGSLYLCS